MKNSWAFKSFKKTPKDSRDRNQLLRDRRSLMGTLANISGKNAVKAFMKAGYVVDHQEGSHIILHNPAPGYPMLVIPDHREVAPYLLKAQIKRAHLTVDEFLKLRQK